MPRSSEDVDQGSSRRRSRRESYTPPPRSRSPSREHRRWSEHDRKRKYDERERYRSRSRERPPRDRSHSPSDTSPRKDKGRRHRRSHDSDPRHDPRHKRQQSRSRSRTPPPKSLKRLAGPLPDQQAAFTKDLALSKGEAPPPEKQKPNLLPTGKLAAAANTVKPASGAGPAIILKYHEPPEARKPPPRAAWRLYVFKDDEIVDTLALATQSAWLFGREAAVADYLVEHPSTSGQHAVLQFRYVEKRDEWGAKKGKVRPYIIDLESANGTAVNGEAVPKGRYVELRDGDVLTLGHSTREYVVQLPPAE